MIDRRRVPPVLIGAAILVAAIYLVLLPSRPFPGDAAIKATPAVLLAAAAWLSRSPRLFVVGLLASAVGDVLLADPGREKFLAGLIAFLIAHVFYVASFFRLPARKDHRGAVLAATAVLLAVAAVLLSRLWPGLGALRIPVVAYVGALLAMTVAALWRRTAWLVPVGALLFVVSDGSLGWSAFVGPFPGSAPLIWATYAAAQVLLTAGMRASAAD